MTIGTDLNPKLVRNNRLVFVFQNILILTTMQQQQSTTTEHTTNNKDGTWPWIRGYAYVTSWWWYNDSLPPLFLRQTSWEITVLLALWGVHRPTRASGDWCWCWWRVGNTTCQGWPNSTNNFNWEPPTNFYKPSTLGIRVSHSNHPSRSSSSWPKTICGISSTCCYEQHY